MGTAVPAGGAKAFILTPAADLAARISGVGGFDGGSFRSRGQDMNAQITVSFDDAAFGCDKVIRLQDERGSVQSLQIHIPAGIDDGKTIRLRGQRRAWRWRVWSRETCLSRSMWKTPSGFFKKGYGCIFHHPDSPLPTAVFGGEVTVPTLKGQVRCNIKAGTQSGSKIRLKGKGIVSMSDPSQYGDQYVTVQIQVPRYLSPEAQQKLKEFEAACKKSGFSAA